MKTIVSATSDTLAELLVAKGGKVLATGDGECKTAAGNLGCQMHLYGNKEQYLVEIGIDAAATCDVRTKFEIHTGVVWTLADTLDGTWVRSHEKGSWHTPESGWYRSKSGELRYLGETSLCAVRGFADGRPLTTEEKREKELKDLRGRVDTLDKECKMWIDRVNAARDATYGHSPREKVRKALDGA